MTFSRRYSIAVHRYDAETVDDSFMYLKDIYPFTAMKNRHRNQTEHADRLALRTNTRRKLRTILYFTPTIRHEASIISILCVEIFPKMNTQRYDAILKKNVTLP